MVGLPETFHVLDVAPVSVNVALEFRHTPVEVAAMLRIGKL